MPFAGLFGLEVPIRALQKALAAEQIAGTYLFVGAEGIGKTTLAKAFAEAAACLNPTRDPFDACGVCESCRRCTSGTQPEIVLIPPAGEQTQIWQFWDRDSRPSGILQHSLPFTPTIGKRRVFIIERADTLTESAANSLLKVLEEPPPYALFLLIVPHAGRLLPTILSRSQILRLMPAAPSALAVYLEKYHALAPEQAQTLAAFAEGRTGQAIRLARNPEVQKEMDRILDFAGTLIKSPPIRALKSGETIRKLAGTVKALAETDTADVKPKGGAENIVAAQNEENSEPASKERVGRRQLSVVLDLLIGFYRDLLALRLGGQEAPILHAGRRNDLAKFAAAGEPDAWLAALGVLLKARRRIEQNASVPLLTDWLAIRLTMPERISSK